MPDSSATGAAVSDGDDGVVAIDKTDIFPPLIFMVAWLCAALLISTEVWAVPSIVAETSTECAKDRKVKLKEKQDSSGSFHYSTTFSSVEDKYAAINETVLFINAPLAVWCPGC